MTTLRCGSHLLHLERPLIMGIVNVTADSFSGDGHAGQGLQEALRHAERLLAEGADMLDIGGESSRPGAVRVSEAEELDRVLLHEPAAVGELDLRGGDLGGALLRILAVGLDRGREHGPATQLGFGEHVRGAVLQRELKPGSK